MSTQNNNLENVIELNRLVANGQAIEALDRFYAEDVSMQDNTEPPTVGKEANRVREEAFMGNVAEWKRYELVAAAAEGDRTFTETIMEFITQDGAEVKIEQATRAIWKDGQIVEERFYHG